MITSPQFIGRSEPEVKTILSHLFPKGVIQTQVPITDLILQEDTKFLDQELKNHKCDITLQTLNQQQQYLVIEVNYSHKEKAAKKWNKIFAPMILKAKKIPVTIDDYDCIHLFQKGQQGHQIIWDDYHDVINQLQKAGVNPQ